MPRVSGDLIFGLSGQTEAEVERDLEFYHRHELSHASVYHLTYEPGTEFHAKLARGEVGEIAPERSRALFALIHERLAGLGLRAYETSNFARPGDESRHNLAYWQARDYHAAGAGAVSSLDRVRVTREKHPAAYISAINAGGDAAWKREAIGDGELLREAWMLGLRLAEGVAETRLDALGDHQSRWAARAAALVQEGLIERRDGRIRLTPAGRPVQDDVTIYLMP